MPKPNRVLLPHGGYEQLRSYQVAVAVYDATVVFCERFYSPRDRMRDQMIQAARSGVRNISEGSGAAATSRRSEMKLTNVARASLGDELAADFRSFLTQRGLTVWDKNSTAALAMRKRLQQPGEQSPPVESAGVLRLNGLDGLAAFVELAEPEIAANALLCATNQAAYLLKRQLQALEQLFLKEGGFSEQLHSARQSARASRQGSPDRHPADHQATSWRNLSAKKQAEPADLSPDCPVCGGPMRLRLARQGRRAGESFWGCCSYPACCGTRED